MSDPVAELRSLVLPCSRVKPAGPGKDLLPTATKFGGAPYLQGGESWPVCVGCKQGLTFVFQWNTADFPHIRGGDELFVFYYCFGCQSWGDLPEGLENAWLLKRYPSPTLAAAHGVRDTSPKDHLIKPCSARIQPAQSLPDWDGLDTVNAALASGFSSLNEDEPWEAYSEAVESLIGEIDPGETQVGGYASWVQGEATPECPECNEPMRLIAQIGSEEKAGLMWGDAGTVYLFGCADCPDTFELRLQCY